VKRILIDARFIGVGESISRYALELTSGILKLDSKNSYTLLIRPEGEKEIERYPEIVEAANLKVDILDIPHYSFAEQTKLLSYLNKEKFDLVHFTQFNHPVLYRGKYVVTIHDLTLIGHLHYHNFAKQLAYNMVMKSAAKDSQKIVAISKTTMDDVIDFFKIDKKKFEVIYHGLDHQRYNIEVKSQKSKVKSFKEKYGIAGEYILYTGAWKKHKNLIRLLQAYEKYVTAAIPLLDKERLGEVLPQLVLVGKIDKKEPEVLAEINRINEKCKMNENCSMKNVQCIVTTGFIEEEELPVAYAGALYYVIPSLSEGFGWPPLEAMACGTPVISSNLSCMPEIQGDAAIYFDPYNVAEIASKIEQFATDEKLREEYAKKGLKQAAEYQWSETVEKTFNIYKQLLQ
jgi:glycosyltransferase involved in cell wall biosynthesis